MFELIELLFSLLFEGLVPTLLEGLVELGWPDIFEKRNRCSWLATFDYVILGLLVGALSIWLFPTAIVKRPFIPGASLVLSPLTGGVTMAYFDSLVHQHESCPRIKFVHGVTFILRIAVLRFIFAQ